MAIEYYLSIKGNKQGNSNLLTTRSQCRRFGGGGAAGALGANHTITIGGNRTENVGISRTVTNGGNQTENVGPDQTITVGGNRADSVGSQPITIGLTRANLTIMKGAGAEDSQFFTALVLRERLQIQYSPHWTAGHRLTVATLTSAIVTGIRSVGRLKEITFRFVP